MVKIERAERGKIDHFSFTLTDKDGNRVFGICLRGVGAGDGRNYSVRRRERKCYCIISRNPYFSLFRDVLTQAYSLSLLRPGGEKSFLWEIFSSPLPPPGEAILVPSSTKNRMYRSLSFVTPIYTASFYRETPIVPLIQPLGPEQFLLVLSAALCERRLIFVAEDVGTLSAAVHAAAAMLYPFQWQHIFIPLLPSRLLSYAAAPVPYMIGIRRYLLPMLFKEAIDDVVIIDLDSGECTAHGNVVIKDFVGSAGTAMKQATETLNRVTAGMTKLLSATTKGPVAGGDKDRDLVACLLSDLRAGMSRQPGASGALFRLGKSAADGSRERLFSSFNV